MSDTIRGKAFLSPVTVRSGVNAHIEPKFNSAYSWLKSFS